MKLIDLVRLLPWPDGAVVCVQELEAGSRAVLSYRSGNQIIKRADESEIADDYDEELVTRGEWIAAQIDERRITRQP